MKMDDKSSAAAAEINFCAVAVLVTQLRKRRAGNCTGCARAAALSKSSKARKPGSVARRDSAGAARKNRKRGLAGRRLNRLNREIFRLASDLDLRALGLQTNAPAFYFIAVARQLFCICGPSASMGICAQNVHGKL